MFVLLHVCIEYCVYVIYVCLCSTCVFVGAPHEAAEGGSDEGEGDLREGGSQGLCAGEGKSAVTSHLGPCDLSPLSSLLPSPAIRAT